METDDILSEKNYCNNITILRDHNLIQCNICKAVFSKEGKYIQYLIIHLYTSHRITELTNHPQREYFRKKFIINEENSEAKCRTCQKVIIYYEYGLYLLKNHVEIYHRKSSHIYHLIVLTENGCHTLKKYFIKGIKATCPKCEIKIDMTHAETRPAEKVKELLDHYFSHRYKEKCFIFVTRRENRFCFTCLVPIISL